MSAFQTLKPSTLSRDAFVKAFADIYEHSPWVAEKAFDLGQDASIDEIETLHQRMSDILLSADHESQLALINAHPDLAGKAAVQGQLTEASTNEQAGAGIHQCTAEEFQRFTELNGKRQQPASDPRSVRNAHPQPGRHRVQMRAGGDQQDRPVPITDPIASLAQRFHERRNRPGPCKHPKPTY
jgi:OHCU decarboxylase